MTVHFRQPRDYQIVAHNTLWDYFYTHTGNPVIAMPTGTGKGTQIAMFCCQALAWYPKTRALILTHVQELIKQDADDMLAVWPDAPMGIYSAGLNQRDMHLPLIIGGVASVINHIDEFEPFDFLIIDECHLLSNNSDTMYQQLIAKLKEKNPYLKVIGFTATPYRQGLGLLTNGGIFTDIIVDMTTMEWYNWFIDQGYLIKPLAMPPKEMFDMTGVAMSGGDFNGKAMNEALSKQDRAHISACREIIQKGADRESWLIFTAGIERAEWVTEFLKSNGVDTVCVHSKMTDRDLRRELINDYRAGKHRCMVGNNVFTTGFNHPKLDLIGMMRPTASPGLWVQMVGRGTRPDYPIDTDKSTRDGRLAGIFASKKRNCLVLDFAGNTERLGPVNDPLLPHKKGKKTGEIPTKICPQCGVYQHLSARNCDNCGHEFDFGVKLSKLFTGEIIKTQTPILEWFNVSGVVYRVHKKDGGRPCVRVSYSCGFRSFDEWLFPEGDRHLGGRARAFWNTRVAPEYREFGPPPTAQDFVTWSSVLKSPKRIQVHMNANNGKYPEVQHYEYE